MVFEHQRVADDEFQCLFSWSDVLEIKFVDYWLICDHENRLFEQNQFEEFCVEKVTFLNKLFIFFNHIHLKQPISPNKNYFRPLKEQIQHLQTRVLHVLVLNEKYFTERAAVLSLHMFECVPPWVFDNNFFLQIVNLRPRTKTRQCNVGITQHSLRGFEIAEGIAGFQQVQRFQIQPENWNARVVLDHNNSVFFNQNIHHTRLLMLLRKQISSRLNLRINQKAHGKVA